jgi:hypothetical protein
MADVARRTRNAKPVPQATPTTQPFWSGTKDHELRMQRCADCGKHVCYPRVRCPHCGGFRLDWEKLSGRATLYSYIVNHQSAPGFADDVPYVVAVVELAEGPHMLANLVDVEPDPERLALDMPLEVVFVDRGDVVLPMYRPVSAPESL